MTTLAWQVERAPSTSQLHVQGYVEFKNARTFSSVKSMMFSSTHIEARKGTKKEAFDYCVDSSKRASDVREEAYSEGERPSVDERGRRTDLDDVRDAVDRGDSMLSIAEEHFGTYVRYNRGIREYQLMRRAAAVATAPRVKKTVIVYYGPTGSGKSRHVDELWPGAFRLSPGSYNNIWWTGYDGQAEVVFDDFYGWIKLDTLLRVLDWYPMSVPSHGGLVPLQANTFVFTSNVEPKDWYRNVPRSVKEALLRRLEFVFKVDYSVDHPCVTCGSFPHQEGCRFVAGLHSPDVGNIDWVSSSLRQRS